jgi:hypothetical protein
MRLGVAAFATPDAMPGGLRSLKRLRPPACFLFGCLAQSANSPSTRATARGGCHMLGVTLLTWANPQTAGRICGRTSSCRRRDPKDWATRSYFFLGDAEGGLLRIVEHSVVHL